jgi:hypothetical protein
MITVKARVRITLDIPCASNWGTDCNFDQVRKQAIDEAVEMVRGEFTSQSSKQLWQIVEPPQVTAVMVSENTRTS